MAICPIIVHFLFKLYLTYWTFECFNFFFKKGGVPIFIKEHWGQKMPHFGIIEFLLKERIPSKLSSCKIFVSRDSLKHALNYNHYI